MTPKMQSSVRPRLACELLPDRVFAARAAERRDLVEAHTARALPAGTLAPSLTTANVLDSAALSRAIEDALGAVSGRSREICVVLPDAAVRVVLLDFDSLPDNREEALGVMRLRLRKSLPFDPDRAVISYHAQRDNGTVNVVAAVALASVINEYETAFQQVGYNPGVVLPSTLASLGVVDDGRPTLVIKADATATTVAIVDQQKVRLIRKLDRLVGPRLEGERLADEIYPSLVFFQDHFGAEIERILVGGDISADQVGPALAAHTSARVEPLVSERLVGGSLTGSSAPAAQLAGVTGVLLG
jgi:type IV pilus assembly protein PilM